MNNETLKNLLLSASIISASAFLTACGDDAAPKSQVEQEQADVDGAKADVDEAKRNLLQQQTELADAAAAAADATHEETNAAVKVLSEEAEALAAAADGDTRPKKLFEALGATIQPLERSLIQARNSLMKLSNVTSSPSNYSDYKILADRLTSATRYRFELGPEKYDELANLRKAVEEAYAKKLTEILPDGAPEDLKKKYTTYFQKVDAEIEAYVIAKNAINQQLAAYREAKDSYDAKIKSVDTAITSTAGFATSLSANITAAKYGTLGGFNTTVQTYFTKNAAALKAGTKNLDAAVNELYTALKTVITASSNILGAKRPMSEVEIKPGYSDNPGAWATQLKELIRTALEGDENLSLLFKPSSLSVPAAAALALSSGVIADLSNSISFRSARTAATGQLDARGFALNGVNGNMLSLDMPLFVNLKGNVSGSKSTEAALGSVAYRMGSTVIGAIQAYANSGTGFGFEGQQLESSVVASHNFGAFFIEGQLGAVSAANVHDANWSGFRSQVTVGVDTANVSPFMQFAHRQLDRNGAFQLNETTAYVGLDAEIAALKADSYSIDSRLLAKVGYGQKAWSANATHLGATTGITGSVEWSGALNLNSGVAFSTTLALDSSSSTTAGLTVSLNR